MVMMMMNNDDDSNANEFAVPQQSILLLYDLLLILTDNKLFENADTAKSRVVQLEIQVAQIQQVSSTTVSSLFFFKVCEANAKYM